MLQHEAEKRNPESERPRRGLRSHQPSAAADGSRWVAARRGEVPSGRTYPLQAQGADCRMPVPIHGGNMREIAVPPADRRSLAAGSYREKAVFTKEQVAQYRR